MVRKMTKWETYIRQMTNLSLCQHVSVTWTNYVIQNVQNHHQGKKKVKTNKEIKNMEGCKQHMFVRNVYCQSVCEWDGGGKWMKWKKIYEIRKKEEEKV